MQKKCQFKNGYTFNRVINGCWQLSAEHCLQGHLDYDDAIHAFHELVEQGFTTFDCADIYTGAEELLGRFVMELKGSGHYRKRISRSTPNLFRIKMCFRSSTWNIPRGSWTVP